MSIVIVLIMGTSILSFIPNHEQFELFGNAGADYVGFTDDRSVNDDSTDTEQSAVAMAQYNNDLYLVWHDMRSGDFDIYFSKSTDGGATWGDGIENDNDIRVDDTDSNANFTDNETLQKYPDIAVDSSGNIYVVWQDDREGRGDTDLYLAKSIDGGSTFGTNIRVDHNGTGSFDQQHPSIEIDGNNIVYVAWEDERNSQTNVDTYYTKSTDGGTSVDSPDMLVDDDTGLSLQKSPELAVFNSGPTTEIYVVWQDERAELGNFDIMFSKSTDGGSTWGDGIDNGNDIIINDNTVATQEHPSIGFDGGGNIVVVWDDERAGNFKDIYMSSSADSGSTWTTNTRLVDAYTNASDQTHPVLSTDNNYLGIAWVDNRNGLPNPDLYFALSDDDGATFGPFLQVNQGPSASVASEPELILNGPITAYIAWEDNRNASRGRDIFFAKSGMIILKAPELSLPGFTPATGQYATQFLFTVTYTDEENDPPGIGYPKLHLFVDDAGSIPFPGSPFQMGWQVDPWQDGLFTNGEIYQKFVTLYEELNYTYYITTKALFGNLTEKSTNLTKGPVLDRQNVTFSDPYPLETEWLDHQLVECGITITDVGFADVELITIKYRVATNGTDNFGDWRNAGLEWNTSGTGVKVSVNVFLDDGTKNYIQWQAEDKFGNGPNESAIYNIKVDTTSVSFSDPVPDPDKNLWHNDEIVEVGIAVKDTGGSGVNASTIEYSYSTTGNTGFGDWFSAGETVDGETVNATSVINFVNGTGNYVRWRATDLMGNGPEESGKYQIRIDTSLMDIKENHIPEPPSNVMPQTTRDRTPYITWDAGTDEDDDALTYWLQIGTSINGSEELSWKDLGNDLYYQVPLNLQVGTFYIHLKCYDGHDFSTVLISPMVISNEGNTPPQPPESIIPEFTSDKRPKISWSEAFDAENDTLTYFIQVGNAVEGEDILERTWVGYQTFYQLQGSPFEYGIYHVTILVYDGNDWSEPGQYTIKIADYQLDLTTTSPISIKQGTSKILELTVSNLGSMPDNVELSYSNDLDGKANLSFSEASLSIGPDGNTTSSLTIAVPPGSALGDNYLKLTATSEDGLTVAEFTVIVTITEAGGIDPTNGDGKNGDSDEDDNENKGFQNFLKGSFFWIIILIIIMVVAGLVYMSKKDSKEKDRIRRDDMYEEDRRRGERARQADYDRMYPSGQESYPPQVGGAAGAGAGVDYGGYDRGTGYDYEQVQPQAPAPEPVEPQMEEDIYQQPEPEYYDTGASEMELPETDEVSVEPEPLPEPEPEPVGPELLSVDDSEAEQLAGEVKEKEVQVDLPELKPEEAVEPEARGPDVSLPGEESGTDAVSQKKVKKID
jgi:hypothetical protein